jgi:hypothetical protein
VPVFAAIVALALVALVFVGLFGVLNRMVFGSSSATASPRVHASRSSQLALLLSLVPVVGLGIFAPPPLWALISQASRVLGGGGP